MSWKYILKLLQPRSYLAYIIGHSSTLAKNMKNKIRQTNAKAVNAVSELRFFFKKNRFYFLSLNCAYFPKLWKYKFIEFRILPHLPKIDLDFRKERGIKSKFCEKLNQIYNFFKFMLRLLIHI